MAKASLGNREAFLFPKYLNTASNTVPPTSYPSPPQKHQNELFLGFWGYCCFRVAKESIWA
jgi:hypothetical protein